MKKLLGIVVLGLLLSGNAHSEDEFKKSLSYLENTVFISGNEWGGKIFVVGVGTRKDGMERWLKRMDLIASERPQKEFCNLFGLKAKKFEFEILKQENYIANKRKKNI